ncbi:MAG: high frequency lysogenization protein HflD [Gammaproteobacteria bacterium]
MQSAPSRALTEDPRQVEQVFALASVFQAAALVQEVARTGKTDSEALGTSLYSVLQLDAESTDSVFGHRAGLRRGLQVLCQQMQRRRALFDRDITRYVISLLSLERKLLKRADLLDLIQNGIRAAAGQAAFFSPTHENVIARLADLYSQSLSTLTPRILVMGEPRYLQNRENVHKIRALLLAGVRGAVLWRQLGGSRWRLLLWQSRQFFRTAEALLETTQQAGLADSHDDGQPSA